MTKAKRLPELRRDISLSFLASEAECLAELRRELAGYDAARISAAARQLISGLRSVRQRQSPFTAFLQEYGLDSAEGVVLMTIAEALLRIPDSQTRYAFLREKLAEADWRSHQRRSTAALVNLSTAGLSVAGRICGRAQQSGLISYLAQLSEPLLCAAMTQAINQLAGHFVVAENIAAAIQYSFNTPAYRYSFDMLGEAALTDADAERYFQAYAQAIAALAKVATDPDIFRNPGISIKLSALYPRYQSSQHRHAGPALSAKLTALAIQARAADIALTVDAEEAERLFLALDVYAQVGAAPALVGWPGLGLALQAYHKAAPAVIRWLAALAEAQGRRIPIRLVKGAYWDTEIKRAQENGWEDYPVFTSKAATDVSYLACAKLILAEPQAFYPQFATHNAHSVAAILDLGGGHPGFEFQRLHGMGAALYDSLPGSTPCRVYAPVGSHRELLPYLVRRLLENAANSSVINQLENPATDPADLCRDPVTILPAAGIKNIAPPPDLFGEQRRNSLGLNLSDPDLLTELQQQWQALALDKHSAQPLINGQTGSGSSLPLYNPADQRRQIGSVINSTAADAEAALLAAWQAFPAWRLQPVAARAGCLRRAADLLEANRLPLAALCIHEGGRQWRDALSEIREAVDYCRYYAAEALRLFEQPQTMPGPLGEANQLGHFGRGVMVCISPWNFPAAIFIGQICAALVAGNTVIAKPAEQTPLTAMFCIRLLHQAGIPTKVLHLLPGSGPQLGKTLLSDARVAGVAFTGSTATAQLINRQLAARNSPIAAFIAETGGQNVMIADSSAHPEQLISDVLQSAFNSAGQRCSALRVLFLPVQTADAIIARLIAAMQCLRVGEPAEIDTDIGPLIDRQAQAALQRHVAELGPQARKFYQLPLADELAHGCFFPPTLLEIDHLAQLPQEMFGPVLHVIRYRASELPQLVAAVNACGYGLTLGVHSRLNAVSRYVQQHAQVGNVYVNRNMIGAVVGVQPFGGMGLSGTGPKAGGPEYLLRFAVEQSVSVNLTAIGGNPGLLGAKP